MENKKTKNAANDPAIFSEVRDFLKGLNDQPGKPMEELSPDEARKVLEGAQKSVKVDVGGIQESTKEITHEEHTVKLHITKPAQSTKNAPAFIFIHGGGWVLGDYPTHQRLVRDLVVESGAVAIFPDYSRSPEAKYPVAIEEIYAATAWVAINGHEIGVDGANLAVVGNSVGGNMSTVIALMCKERKGPVLKKQVLLWPVTDANFDTESYHLYAEERFLTRNMMIWFWDNYLPNLKERKSTYASPLQASHEQLKGLPPALVITAENDVLRDEGEAYARKLDEAGVDVTLFRQQGMIHDFGLLNPLASLYAVQQSIQFTAVALREALK